MINITNTNYCPYISPSMYKATNMLLRTSISPGLIFGGLPYCSYIQQKFTNYIQRKIVTDKGSI